MGDSVTIGLLFTASAGAAVSAITSIGSTVDKLTDKGKRTSRAFTEIGAAIKKSAAAGNDVAALTKRYEGLWSSIERAKSATLGLQAAQDKAAGHRAAIGSLWGQALGTVGMGASLALPVKEAIDFEKAMAGVKTILPDATPEQMGSLRKQLIGLSREIPVNSAGFADMAKSAGQLGIAMNDIPDFTKVVSKISAAFEMPAEEAGAQMAQISNVYNIPIEKMTHLGDAISKLSAVGSAKVPDIINSTNRIGGMASAFGKGMNVEQASAWMNTFVGVGVQADDAATAMNAMLMDLNNADKRPKEFQKALHSLGLTAKGLKKAIGEDASGALEMFLNRMSKAPLEKQSGLMEDLFQREHSPKLIKLLGPKAKQLLADSMSAVKNSDGTTERVFRDYLSTTDAQLKLLRNNTTELGIRVGTVLLPALNNVIGTVRPMVYTMIEWSNAHPGLVANIGKVAAGLVAFSAAGLVASAGYHGLAFGVWSVIAPLRAVRTTWLVTSAAFKAQSLGAAVAQFGMVGKAATAVGATIAGITAPAWVTIAVIGAGFAAAGFLVYKYWGPIKGFFVGLWKGILIGAAPLVPMFKSVFGRIGRDMSALGNFIQPLIGWFKDLIKPVGDTGVAAEALGVKVGIVIGTIIAKCTALTTFLVGLPHEFTKIGADMITGLIQGITGKFEEAKKTITGLGGSIKGWFSSTLGISSPSKVFWKLGGFLGDGLSMGIGSSMGQVRAAAGQLASASIPQLGAVARQAMPSLPKLPSLQGMAQQSLSGGLPSLPKLPNPSKSYHTTMSFNPTIHMAAGVAGDVAGQVRGALDMGFEQFRKQMKQYEQEMGRRAFGGAHA